MLKKNRKIKPYELALPGYFYQTAKFANKILEVDWTDYFMPSTFKYSGRYELLGTCPLADCCSEEPTLTLFNENEYLEGNRSYFRCSACHSRNMDVFEFIQKTTGCNYETAVQRFALFCEVSVVIE